MNKFKLIVLLTVLSSMTTIGCKKDLLPPQEKTQKNIIIGGNIVSDDLDMSYLPYQQYVIAEYFGELIEMLINMLDTINENDYYILQAGYINDSVLFYGYVTPYSEYYNDSIFEDTETNPYVDADTFTNENMVYGHLRIKTRNANRLERWVKRKTDQGYVVTIYKRNNVYYVTATHN